jgi:hypothetical protein
MMLRMRAAVPIAVAVVLTACGAERSAAPGPAGTPSPSSPSRSPMPTPSSPSPSPSVSPEDGAARREWLAVFRAAEDPERLAGLERAILDAAPRNAAVSPAGCWEGVPEALGVAPTDYVAGVVARTKEELDTAVTAVDREPILRRQVTLIAC